MLTAKQQRDELKRIVGLTNEGERFPIMSGKVNSVDNESMTCEVQLTCRYDPDEASTTPGVLLNVVTGNIDGWSFIPAKDADCVVAEIDGLGNLKQLLWASKYTKAVFSVSGKAVLTITDGKLQMNDGSLKGIPILDKVQDNLNALKNYAEGMKSAVATAMTAIGAGSGASGPNGTAAFNQAMASQNIDFENMENKNVTHG